MARLRQGNRLVELIAAVIITAGFFSSIVLQVLSCGSAAWSDSTACMNKSTPTSCAPASTPFSMAPQNGLARVFISAP